MDFFIGGIGLRVLRGYWRVGCGATSMELNLANKLKQSRPVFAI